MSNYQLIYKLIYIIIKLRIEVYVMKNKYKRFINIYEKEITDIIEKNKEKILECKQQM